MFRLHGFHTQNSRKPLYVLEAVGAEFEFVFTDLAAGTQRSDEFLNKNPVGKVPVLEHDGRYLFESGAISRYVANVMGSDLYPADAYQRGVVDQWLDFFAAHAGHWLTILYFQTVIKPRFGLGEPNERRVAEATKFAAQMLGVVETHLESASWLANDRCSIADLCAFAYVEQEKDIEFSIAAYPNLGAWYQRMEKLESITAARARLPK